MFLRHAARGIEGSRGAGRIGGRQGGAGSAVHVAPVADVELQHAQATVLDIGDQSVIADPEAPPPGKAAGLDASRTTSDGSVRKLKGLHG